MEGEDSISATAERSSSNGKVSYSKRAGLGSNRTWGRISLGGLGPGRRREKELKRLTSRSPPRRMTLGGDGVGVGVGVGGAAYHGRHGIRYKQQHSLPEEYMQREAYTTALPKSPPLVLQLSQRLTALEADTIAEEEGSREEDHEGDVAERDRGLARGEGETSPPTQRRDNATRMEQLMSLHVDKGGGDVVLQDPLSPASARRASMSPVQVIETSRARTQSWAPSVSSPGGQGQGPVLSGPFSRTRSRSRSPRHAMSVAAAPSLDSLPRLQGDLGRLSSSGGAELPPPLSKDASVSTAEEYLGWSESDKGAPTPGGEEEHPKRGPFTENSTVMARLRLPNMEMGFDEDGFFGIDVRSLIIGKEIARGAYGVVHEATLLAKPLEEGEGGSGEQAGSPIIRRVEGTPAPSPRAGTGEATSEISVQEGAEDRDGKANDPKAGTDARDPDGREGRAPEADKHQGEMPSSDEGTSVAVKIQQVPEDEEEQANLLGELGMLRNFKHPHLVEYIGSAMAIERGKDTVMVAMELCSNGALREALKLNLSWPLKIRIALDMTDGLQYLHQHGIIHRDIKTPNVLIDSSWRAKLCDYNFAIDENSTIKQDFCAGTAEFMSPEVLLSDEYGLPSDIFSLGMIFVEMLTGQEPSSSFPERPPQGYFVVSEEEIEGELLPEHPPSFALLQSQCLFADASERPTAEDAHNWLQDLLKETGEESIVLPQKKAPLPVLTEGAAIAREGNVINASPKGSESNWFASDAMEHQIGSMVESAVDRALAERGERLGLAGAGEVGEEEKLEAMKAEIETLREACDERDSRIADLEVQALRNTSTLKMLSSALEVAYKMLESQQATLCRGSATSNSDAWRGPPAERDSLPAQENDDASAV